MEGSETWAGSGAVQIRIRIREAPDFTVPDHEHRFLFMISTHSLKCILLGQYCSYQIRKILKGSRQMLWYLTYLGILVSWPPAAQAEPLKRCPAPVVLVTSCWIRNQDPFRRVPQFPSYERFWRSRQSWHFLSHLVPHSSLQSLCSKKMSPDFKPCRLLSQV